MHPSVPALCALVFAGIACDARAAILKVTNCDNSGTGSLRAAIASALSGDLIDMRGLACTRVNLSGALVIPQRDLAIRGPGTSSMTLNARNLSGIVRHTGTGLLKLRGLLLEQGRIDTAGGRGGCVSSEGRVELADMHVRDCSATGGTTAAGGGVWASGGIGLSYSTIELGQSYGAGGGVATDGRLLAQRSRIVNNTARVGGGARAASAVVVESTFDNNSASDAGGGLALPTSVAQSGVYALFVTGSTFSWNNGGVYGGGIYASTIAHSQMSVTDTAICSGALQVPAGAFTLVSTIVAHTTCNAAPIADVAAGNMPQQARVNMVTRLDTTPAEHTFYESDPELSPLAYNGGQTQTHALAETSPAVDMGVDWVGVWFDQRGPGYPRQDNGGPDIGAYEGDTGIE